MGKTSTQKTEAKPPAWATPLFKESAKEAQSIYDSGAGGNVYQGQTVADLSGTTQSGIGGIQSTVSGMPDTTSSSSNLQSMAAGNSVGGNPYFQQTLENQLGKTADLINSKFSGSGRYGSGANSAVLGTELGNVATNALSNQYNQDLQNQLSANSLIDSTNSNMFRDRLTGNQSVLGAGQVQDANQQAKLTADFTKWQSEDMLPWTRLGLLQSAAAGSAGNYGTNTQTQTQPFNAMQGIGALGSLFTKSDARIKDRIKPVGRKNGLTVYEWSYRGTSARYRGVMAQDVIDVDPLAVVDLGGVYAVNYARVGIKLERVA